MLTNFIVPHRHPAVPRAGEQVEPDDNPERRRVRRLPRRRQPGHARGRPRRHRQMRLPSLPPPLPRPKVPVQVNGVLNQSLVVGIKSELGIFDLLFSTGCSMWDNFCRHKMLSPLALLTYFD